jgi:hypothetical protein
LKQVLRIPLADTSNDSVLGFCLECASRMVYGLLNALNLVVPSVVPKLIANATKYFAAWNYQRQRGLENAEMFWRKADKSLSAYIDMFCRGSVSFQFAKNHPRDRRRIPW